jgi:hypothetical protein
MHSYCEEFVVLEHLLLGNFVAIVPGTPEARPLCAVTNARLPAGCIVAANQGHEYGDRCSGRNGIDSQ